MYTVFTVNEATATQYKRGSFKALPEAISSANEEISPRARKFFKAVILDSKSRNVYEVRGEH